MAHRAPVDQEKQWYDFFGITAVLTARRRGGTTRGALKLLAPLSRVIVEWRIFHRKKKRRGHSR